MDNQPAFDRSLFIPISLGGFSIIGIIVVLLIGRGLSSPPEVPMTPSPTRFQYVFLGTEPAITTPIIEGTEFVPTEELPEAPTEGLPTLSTPTPPGISTPIILTQPNSNNTPTTAVQRTNTPPPPTVTSASGPPLNPGTYDDGHQYLIYDGWAPSGAVHVSFEPGNTISFRFIGTQVRLIYQGGSTLGQVTITIDNQSFALSQSTGNEWASTTFTNGTHTVLITHTGGGSVNLDQIIIPDPSTPTPTPTRTPGEGQ